MQGRHTFLDECALGDDSRRIGAFAVEPNGSCDGLESVGNL